MIDIYVINMSSCGDRWKSISKTFLPDCRMVRFLARHGRPGWKYCALSHLEVVKYAQQKDLPFVIVAEDDNVFVEQSDRSFNSSFKSTIKWLTSNKDKWNIFNGNPANCNLNPAQSVNTHGEQMVSYEFGKTTNFMIYNSNAYDKILSLADTYENISENECDYEAHAYDRLLCTLGLKLVTRVPYVTTQAVGQSIIEDREVNYHDAIFDYGESFLVKKLNAATSAQ